ncbi:MAG: PAS domain S-box protein, partial [Deinococcota bacterium]|nr:PAS domain S-box protein [Deinococcota bacterium]
MESYLESGVVAMSEAERLLELRRYEILDTSPEAAFDAITSLAARMFEAPIAIISFVDEDRQWLKSCYGLELDSSQTARELSFCHYNIKSDKVMVVEDAPKDPRFKDNPLVTAEPYLRFYAGAPLITSRGYRLGALCLLDRRPRPFTAKEQGMLAELAAFVVGGLEGKLKDHELARAQAQSEARSQQRAEEERERLFTLSPDLLCVVGPDGYFKRVNPAWQEVLGYSSEELLAQPFMNLIHPDDHEATEREVQRLVAQGGQTRSFENRYRAKDGGYRWFLWSAIVYEEGELCYAVARDMTESKRAQEALERNAKRVNTILLSITDAFVSVGTDWRFSYLNPQAERLLKRPKEEVLGKRIGEVLPEALGTRFEKEFREALRTKQPVTFEDYYAPLAGWFEVHVYPSDEGVAVYFQNITERKEAKRDLERSLSLLRTTLEATADGIVSVDITGKLITYNHKFAQMWGFPEELLAAGDDARLLDYAARQLADPEGFLRRVQELYASDEAESYDLLELKDGRVWERHLQLQKQGPVTVGWVWSFRDVSESRRAAAAISEANEFKTKVMQSVTEAIVALDLDGNFTFVNKRLCEIVGCDEESLIGDAFFGFATDGAKDELAAQFRRAAAGKVVPPFETALRRQDGTEATVALSFSPLLSGGEVSGVVATAEDITQTKRAMDRLRLLD